MQALIYLLALFLILPLAHAQQDPAPVKIAIESWLKLQLKDLPGQVSYEIGSLSQGNQLKPCSRFDISRPSGGQAWGRTNVLVRCLDEAAWRVYVPVHVRVKTDYLISARAIAQGQTVVEADLATQLGELAELPAQVLTDTNLAIGKVATMAIPAGQALRSNMFKALTVIHQGQNVKVISRGAGFEVANVGRALNNAAAGQRVQVKLGSGQIVSGDAKADGSIEID